MTELIRPSMAGGGLTSAIAKQVGRVQFDALPLDVRFLARQCILDWIGVTLAGTDEPLVEILLDQMNEQGGHPHATIVGHVDRLPTLAAALVNGAASHALDYDDVNLSMTGHPTVAVLPGLLALAEQRNARGAALIAAFVAGYETVCHIGSMVGSGHYARGFHSTATLGSFGSASACAHLLQLNEAQTATALGIAGTQAAGMKSMFGTMCKPLHAGKAAYNGLFAALSSARGFESRTDVLEAPQGFIATQCDGMKAPASQTGELDFYFLRNNLFKYHAACYLTHSAIECARLLRKDHVQDITDIRRVVVRVDASCDKACNIQAPRTGLEAKFSLRQTVAFSLASVDTSRLDTYDRRWLSDPVVTVLRDKVTIELLPNRPHTQAEMELELHDGSKFHATHDSGVPSSDFEEQGQRIDAKFLALAAPRIGEQRAQEILHKVHGLDALSSVSELTRLLVPTSN